MLEQTIAAPIQADQVVVFCLTITLSFDHEGLLPGLVKSPGSERVTLDVTLADRLRVQIAFNFRLGLDPAKLFPC